MSFEVFAFRFEGGDVKRFDDQALRAVLERHALPYAVGAQYLLTRDGLAFELTRTDSSGTPDHDELLLTMRAVSEGMFELLYELAHAARLTVVAPGGDGGACVLVADASLVAELPEPYALIAVVCRSAEELASRLLPVYEAWRNWAL